MAYVHHTTDTFNKVISVPLTRDEIVEAFKRLSVMITEMENGHNMGIPPAQ